MRKASKPLGSLSLEIIARTMCKEFGYLCFDKRNLGDAYSLIATELAVLETYQLLSQGSGTGDEYELVLACLNDEECLYSLIDTVNNVLDIYLNGSEYFLSLSQDDLERVIRMTETIISKLEKRASSDKRQGTEARARIPRGKSN